MARQTNKQKKAERRANAGRPVKARSRVASAAAKVKEVLQGTPNPAAAPGAYQQIFRYSQLAVGAAGADRNINDIWATFLDDMTSQGMPQESIARLEQLGGKTILNADGIPKSITEALPDADSLKAVKESHKMAKAAVLGITGGKTGIKNLDLSWSELLDEFAKDADFATDDGKRIIAELRKLDPKMVAKVGSNQTLSIMARRGDDPFWTKQFNKVFKRQNTAVLPSKMVNMLRETNKGLMPKVSKETIAALVSGGGATTKSLTGGIGRKAIGLLGKGVMGAAGTGLFLGIEANRMIGILGREGRARKMAELGIAGLGPSSSVEFLRDRVDKQEQASRRKMTMQKFEPQMFNDVVRILSDSGDNRDTLTSTERRIGKDAQMGIQRRGRSSEDVKFLLDQLFNQMGDTGGQ